MLSADHIDLAEAERFLKLLDPKATKFTFQTFDDNAERRKRNKAPLKNKQGEFIKDKRGRKVEGKDPFAEILSGTLDQRLDQLTTLNQQGAGVFATINETNLKGRKIANIKRIRSVFVDLDGSPLDLVLNDPDLPKPHMVIMSSPGKWQVYWLVKGLALKDFEKIQKWLAKRFNGDPAVHDLPRVMRLPGFWHRKGKPFQVKIISANDDAPYDAKAFMAKLGEDDTPQPDDDTSNPFTDQAKQNENRWQKLNSEALANLGKWVPKLFPDATTYNDGYRVSSASLGRDLEEDIGITPHGIKDFGVHDIGDDREGKRSPIDLVMEWQDKDFEDAAAWLYQQLEIAPPPDDETSDHDSTVVEFNPVDLWGKFEPPQLPTGLLPETIERFARIEGANMGCDPAGLAMSALTACAAVISDTIKLQVKEHDEYWTEAARLWTALVGDPSGKKTPQLSQAAWPVGKIDRRLTAEYLAEKEVYDKLSAADKKNNPAPKHRRVKLEDTTIEAAQEVLKDSPDGVLCLQDELSGFFGMMDKYSGNKGAGADRAFWMKAYNGGPSTFHRITRGSGTMPNLSVCLLGGIQPDAIRKLAADGIEDGLLQRALFIVLRPATVDQDKPRDPVVGDYFRLVDKLLGLIPPQRQSFNDNKFEFTVLRFDPAAQVIRNQLAQKHIDLMKSESVNKKLATHVGKYDGVFARLCVLWHCIENVDLNVLPTIVTEDTARRVATFLHEFILKHAIMFYAGILGIADDHDRLRNVASYILARKLDKITNRDIAHGDRSMRKLTDWDTLKIFEQLEALGWVDRQLPKKPPQKIQWIVNPLVHTQFADRAKREKERRDDAREAVADLFK